VTVAAAFGATVLASADSGTVTYADHLVACVDQLGNEPDTDRTARSCDEDSHRVLLCLACHTGRVPGVIGIDPWEREDVTHERGPMAG
jgi:hypothetical protein